MSVRAFCDAFNQLQSAHAGRTPKQLGESVRCVEEALDQLMICGCDVEAHMLKEFRGRIAKPIAITVAGRGLLRCIDQVITRLLELPMLSYGTEEAADTSVERSAQVIFIRHGESTGNIDHCLQGSRIGGTLTDRGRAQAAKTGAYLFEGWEGLRGGNAMLFSSSVGRSQETASAIAEEIGSQLFLDPALGELDFGDWSGRFVKDLKDDPAYSSWTRDPWFTRPPGGESLFDVRTRVCESIANHVRAAHTLNRPLVVVTHFFPLMAFLGIVLPGDVMRCDNCSITSFRCDLQVWYPTRINYVAHLGSLSPAPVRYV